ncbi:MAG: response regulator transcription factor [Gammaproteobacteria bacterium]|nr:response regulator transcription factor [Gammaproteobacteria bacterium]
MDLNDTLVFIVDDNPLVRDSLKQLVKSIGLEACTFSSAQEFLDTNLPDKTCCLVLDVRMPKLSGLELQEKLQNKGSLIPIIFMSGHGTVPISVRAMKAGAIDFLQKPFEDQVLIDAIHHALRQNKKTRHAQLEVNKIKKNIQSLTQREYEVLIPVVSGTLNKEIAYHFNMSESTVKTHRSHIMKKMAVNSLAELVRATEKAKIFPQQK